MELTEGDSLEGSAHTSLYNPHIVPLKINFDKHNNINMNDNE